MSALPTCKFHKITAELLLPRPERASTEITPLGIRFAGVNRRIIDFERGLITAIVNVGRCFLDWVITGDIDAVDIHFSYTVGHHVGQYLTYTGCVLDPH